MANGFFLALQNERINSMPKQKKKKGHFLSSLFLFSLPFSFFGMHLIFIFQL